MADKKKWMQGAVKKKGSFRSWLGKKKGEKVTSSDIAKGEQSKSGLVRKRASLAKTFAKFRKGG